MVRCFRNMLTNYLSNYVSDNILFDKRCQDCSANLTEYEELLESVEDMPKKAQEELPVLAIAKVESNIVHLKTRLQVKRKYQSVPRSYRLIDKPSSAFTVPQCLVHCC